MKKLILLITLCFFSTVSWAECVEGDCVNGLGTRINGSGDKYVGQFRNGKRNGQGTMTWPDGREYVGNFAGGVIKGFGTMTYADGKKYVGRWRNNLKSGGTKTYPSGRSSWVEAEYRPVTAAEERLRKRAAEEEQRRWAAERVEAAAEERLRKVAEEQYDVSAVIIMWLAGALLVYVIYLLSKGKVSRARRPEKPYHQRSEEQRQLDKKISDEKRAETAKKLLAEKLAREKRAKKIAEQTLAGKLAREKSAKKLAEQTLAEKLAREKRADEELSRKIAKLRRAERLQLAKNVIRQVNLKNFHLAVSFYGEDERDSLLREENESLNDHYQKEIKNFLGLSDRTESKVWIDFSEEIKELGMSLLTKSLESEPFKTMLEEKGLEPDNVGQSQKIEKSKSWDELKKEL